MTKYIDSLSKYRRQFQKEEGELVLQVRDTGKELLKWREAGPRSLGLIGMRERARHDGCVVSHCYRFGVSSSKSALSGSADQPASPDRRAPGYPVRVTKSQLRSRRNRI